MEASEREQLDLEQLIKEEEKKENPFTDLKIYEASRTLIEYGWNWNQVSENNELDENEKKMALYEIEEKMTFLMEHLSRKFDNAVAVIKDLEAKEQAMKEIATQYQKRSMQAKSSRESLKAYLKSIGEINPKAIVGEAFKGSIYSKPSVREDLNVEDMPDFLIRVKEVKSIDKKKILDAYKEGTFNVGNMVVEKTHLRIS